LGQRSSGDERRQVGEDFDWLRAECGGQRGEVGDVRQAGVGQGYFLLREEWGENRDNGAKRAPANAVVVLSRDMLEGAMRNANLLATPDETECRAKTHIIHVWSDDRLINPVPKSASHEAHRLGVLDRFVVQYSGNHGRFHDIETFLGIAKTFANDTRFALQFIGEGQKKAMVDGYIKTEHPRAIYASTYVPKEMLADSLAMADLGVVALMSGQERVCYPSKLLGVMAAGRAILAICPPDCEMGRMIREHELGWVVANGDIEGGHQAVLEAQADKRRVARMGENAARLLRERFTLAQAADAYWALITGHAPWGSKSSAL
jgi:glycosyltransferase involved in cell wall biosynthesis